MKLQLLVNSIYVGLGLYNFLSNENDYVALN